MKQNTDLEKGDLIHFEIRRSVVHDGLQREFVEIFETLNNSDYCKEIKKLQNVNPDELKVIIITNLGPMKHD